MLRALAFAIAALALPAFAQPSATLVHSIPAPLAGVQSQAYLGGSVAVEGGYTIVGASGDDTGAEDAGVVKVFDTATGTLLHVLANPAPEQSDRFGDAVAISGTRVVVGAYGDNPDTGGDGSAYVYDLAGAAPTVPVLTLTAPNPAESWAFGISVAISGSRVVVGDHGDESAFVYDLAGATPTVPVATLNNPDPGSSESFGSSVAISGTRVVVGAYNDDTGASDAGSAYVYDLGGATPTVPVATLNNPTPADNDSFGWSVAISGTWVVVGAYADDTGATNAGSAYVYDLTGATPTVPMITLNSPDLAFYDQFGWSVAISGTRVVVGSLGNPFNASSTGSAYVYDLAGVMPTVPVFTLNRPAQVGDDSFGSSVAISGTWVVVGAPGDDTGAPNAGSAFVYDLAGTTPTVPVSTPNDPSPKSFEHFGQSVALSGTRMVVGAPGGGDAGSVFVYDLAGATPTVPVVTINGPSPASAGSFGSVVAISGMRVVVADPYDDTGATDAGRVHVYDLAGATPTVPVVTLNSPAPAEYHCFGSSVAISGTRVVVGDPFDDSAYVYDLAGTTPSMPIALNNPSAPESGSFGYSVAISGTWVAVGDPFQSVNHGNVYLYDLAGATPTVPMVTLNNPDPAEDDAFGLSVAVSGSRLAVGAFFGAYVYDLAGATPTVPIATLSPPDLAGGYDIFGTAVTISGTRVIVGHAAHLAFGFLVPGAPFVGNANVYDLAAAMPTVPIATLNSPLPTDDIKSVAIDGATIALGVPGDDAVVTDKGAAYVFDIADTTPPVIGGSFSPRTVFAGTLPDYRAQVVTSDNVGVVSVTQVPPANSTTQPGAVVVTLTAHDAAGNTTEVSFTLQVRPLAAVNRKFLAAGEPAPGRAASADLPDDAVLASFGTPAIDDEGNIAFVAKWTSATGPVKRGKGLFLNDKCLAVAGGDASAIAVDAKWKSFSDPVVEDGKLACLAKLSTGATAVVCTFTGSALEKIALTGEVAIGAGDAKFKSFKAVALHGGAIGFLAQLSGGSAANKITPANDTGVWFRAPSGPLALLYRDGFNLGKTVGSFVSFAPGDGSPGCGRGWFSYNSGPLVLTLNTFTDKTKGIIFGGDGGATSFAQSGDAGTNYAPALAGASFATFRLPTMNDALQSAFYATMKVGEGGVTKADAGGIFAVDADFSGPLAPNELVARLGDDAGATGGKFKTLKDPVLASDGGIAFPATLTLKGPGAQTLWWRPPGGALRLLAQGGDDADEVPGAKWKSFSSLAIAGGGRGPIFTATLSTRVSGVWAIDFTGAARLLFKTGDQIDGKPLKGFTLLKGSVGSNGVTRNFNDAAQVVWLATFTDKTQAIVTTEVP